ncbi:hypothetical protein ACQE3E_15605 [Methylomonas sp. MED-D]|uniref:hypothetical protein n=1 Tax=unclassified Methylomonas TaxID=2608980 RepID=UPI003D01469F
MSYQDAKFWFDVIQTLLILVVGIMNWLNNRQRVTTATISKLENDIDDRLDDHAERVTRLEERVSNAPNHEDLAEIYREMRTMSKSLSDMNAALAAQTATLEAVRQQVARMDTFFRGQP